MLDQKILKNFWI